MTIKGEGWIMLMSHTVQMDRQLPDHGFLSTNDVAGVITDLTIWISVNEHLIYNCNLEISLYVIYFDCCIKATFFTAAVRILSMEYDPEQDVDIKILDKFQL